MRGRSRILERVAESNAWTLLETGKVFGVLEELSQDEGKLGGRIEGEGIAMRRPRRAVETVWRCVGSAGLEDGV